MGEKKQEFNGHHLLYFKRAWMKGEWSRKIRQHPACIVKAPVQPHVELHRELWEGIPLAQELTCETAFRQVDSLWKFGAIRPETDVEIRLELLINLFGGNCQETARALERELAIIREIRGGG